MKNIILFITLIISCISLTAQTKPLEIKSNTNITGNLTVSGDIQSSYLTLVKPTEMAGTSFIYSEVVDMRNHNKAHAAFEFGRLLDTVYIVAEQSYDRLSWKNFVDIDSMTIVPDATGYSFGQFIIESKLDSMNYIRFKINPNSVTSGYIQAWGSRSYPIGKFKY